MHFKQIDVNNLNLKKADKYNNYYNIKSVPIQVINNFICIKYI